MKKTIKECADAINGIITYYGFPPILPGVMQEEYMPRLLEFMEYLHGYTKDFVSTDSIR